MCIGALLDASDFSRVEAWRGTKEAPAWSVGTGPVWEGLGDGGGGSQTEGMLRPVASSEAFVLEGAGSWEPFTQLSR